MKDSKIDKQFNNETLPQMQDLSKHYKELLQKKHKLTRKQPNESQNFKNFDSFT